LDLERALLAHQALPYGWLRASDWAEMGCDAVVDSDSQIPWFSGLCLEGEVAAQYRIEGREGQEGDSPPPSLELDNLAPITIFVGANNSGKSRLLREIFSREDFSRLKLRALHPSEGYVDLIPKLSEWHKQLSNDGMQIPGDWLSPPELQIVNATILGIDDCLSGSIHSARRETLEEIKGNISSYGLLRGIPAPVRSRRCYVPMMRGMRPPFTPKLLSGISIAPDERDLYSVRTHYDYFTRSGALNWDLAGDPKMTQVFSGLGMYGDLRRRLLGRSQELRNTVKEYERLLSDLFFGSEAVTLTPVEGSEGGHENDVVHIKIGCRPDYPIHALGDGMQSLIICTYPIVTETKAGSLFFLEEPDLCMHPSLQRTFLEVLKDSHRKMGHQFFVTTHSNHLLDLVDDPYMVSILNFSAIGSAEEAISPPATSPVFQISPVGLRDRDVLARLGVRPSATFLANSTIWVEGVSDASYLRAYMEAFTCYLSIRGSGDWRDTVKRLRQYKEDLHYAFVEYGGANLVHLQFEEPEENDSPVPCRQHTTVIPGLCAKAIVVADGDIGDALTKGDRLQDFRHQLESRLIVLPGKEIENLIPVALVKCQVREDHASNRRGSVAEDVIDSIDYASYSRSCAEASKLIGLGAYLGGSLQIVKYNSMETLSDYYKRRWRSASDGIPRKIREAFGKSSDSETPDASDTTVNELPMYLTHDLLWLCTCIYLHIAECNHHTSVARQLRDFQQHLREWHQLNPASSSLPSGAEGQEESWPIHNPSDRRCPLMTPPRHANTESASTA
jgi:hypothetical protein